MAFNRDGFWSKWVVIAIFFVFRVFVAWGEDMDSRLGLKRSRRVHYSTKREPNDDLMARLSG